jgi:hypothetical protein
LTKPSQSIVSRVSLRNIHQPSPCSVDPGWQFFRSRSARPQLLAREGKSAAFDLIAKSFANLMRMWVED